MAKPKNKVLHNVVLSMLTLMVVCFGSYVIKEIVDGEIEQKEFEHKDVVSLKVSDIYVPIVKLNPVLTVYCVNGWTMVGTTRSSNYLYARDGNLMSCEHFKAVVLK